MASAGFPESVQTYDISRGGSDVPLAPMLCAFIVFLWVLYRSSVQRKNTLAPGPFSLPVVGNLNQLGKLPHRDLHELGKKYGPIMTLKLGSFHTVVVSSSAMAKEFVKTHDLVFSSRPAMAVGKYIAYNFRDVAIAPYGLYWRHMRKLCVVGLLSPKRLESFKSLREEEARLFVRSVWEMSAQGKKPVNFTKLLLTYTLATMWRILSGKQHNFYSDAHQGDGGEEIVKMFTELSFVSAEVNVGDFLLSLHWVDSISGVKQRMKKVHSSFDRVVREITEEHKAQRRRNMEKQDGEKSENAPGTKVFVDELLEMETLDGMPITEENIKAIVLEKEILQTLACRRHGRRVLNCVLNCNGNYGCSSRSGGGPGDLSCFSCMIGLKSYVEMGLDAEGGSGPEESLWSADVGMGSWKMFLVFLGLSLGQKANFQARWVL